MVLNTLLYANYVLPESKINEFWVIMRWPVSSTPSHGEGHIHSSINGAMHRECKEHLIEEETIF